MPHESSTLRRFEPLPAAVDAAAVAGQQSAVLEAEIQALLSELEGKLTRFTWLNSSAGVSERQREENLHSLSFMQVALEDVGATVLGISAAAPAGGESAPAALHLPTCS
ncbi:hypothetical protein [Arthrobacter mangrovi]|uniref:Uncharacterized protein n=1 Tax=Arthrobacter mangrovi TaxID=2966350 RepID=A0ABQ5MVX7_9MICC|nr:hypothetical protein [Arthrobacter mangrovi]GLB68150.1 hypothetical protein AHIS1636_25920 [Arthrobacter mangrovi]